MLERWRNATIRAALERFAPHYLPGVPLEAALCLGASSTGPTEDLGTAVGLFGVERSRINAWSRDDETRRVLGRTYDPAGYARDLEAQVYTGMRRYALALSDARAAVGAAPASALPPWFSVSAVSPWEYQCAVATYSSGGRTVARLVGPRARALGELEPAARFPALSRDVFEAAHGGDAATVDGVALRGLVGAAWTVTRPRQRYETARAVAVALRRPLAWYSDRGAAADVDAALSRWTQQ